jgi:hypothetical protein
MKSRLRLRYIELLTGHHHDGPAWIAFVQASKSGSQLYFNGKALARVEGSRHMDVETREYYWASGVKKDGRDRHWAGGGKVLIEKSAVPSYLRLIASTELDASRFNVIDDLPATDVTKFHAIANQPVTAEAYEADVRSASPASRKRHVP